MLEKPVLIGKVVTLRPINKSDAPHMFAALSDEESMRLTGTQQSYSLEQVEKFCKAVSVADDRADYAITINGDPTYIGEAVLNEIDWENRNASFRIALASHQSFGKGFGTEATQLILNYGFGTLKLHRIELEVYDFNPRAIRVYEKVGFVREGERRDALLWDGNYQSAIIMSILASEFKSSKQ
jgi:RimJ/RimL family protein N-acetyltransferase